MHSTLDHIDYILDRPMKILMKMVESVPDEKIQFRPYQSAMSVAELVCHILSVFQTHIFAISESQGMEEHAQRIPIEAEKIMNIEELLDHNIQVIQVMKEEISKFTPDLLEKINVYRQWNNYAIQGERALLYIIEEFFHHRGQLSTYLRLLGLESPFLYQY